MRDDYLGSIDKYRKAGRRIYFQVETWLFENMSCSKGATIFEVEIPLRSELCFISRDSAFASRCFV